MDSPSIANFKEGKGISWGCSINKEIVMGVREGGGGEAGSDVLLSVSRAVSMACAKLSASSFCVKLSPYTCLLSRH